MVALVLPYQYLFVIKCKLRSQTGQSRLLLGKAEDFSFCVIQINYVAVRTLGLGIQLSLSLVNTWTLSCHVFRPTRIRPISQRRSNMQPNLHCSLLISWLPGALENVAKCLTLIPVSHNAIDNWEFAELEAITSPLRWKPSPASRPLSRETEAAYQVENIVFWKVIWGKGLRREWIPGHRCDQKIHKACLSLSRFYRF